MAKNPKITVIIPVYNAEKYIERCLDSILAQKYSNFEVILIDDGSEDNSLKILKKYEKNSRVKIYTQRNQGAAKARDRGVELATGEYVLFVDDDDYITNDQYLNIYTDVLKEDKYDIVLGGYRRINSYSKNILTKHLNIKSEWSKYIVVAPWAKLYKRRFLDENNLCFFDNAIGEDTYLNLVAYSKTNKIRVINNIDYVWFYNNASVSNTIQRGLNKSVDILKWLDATIEKTGLDDQYRRFFFRRYIIWYLLFSGRNSNQKTFFKYYKKFYEWQKSRGVLHTISPLSFKLRGEGVKNRLIVWGFMIIERLRLVRVFAWFYCKK